MSYLKILKISPFRRADFISSAALQGVCSRQLQLHTLQLAAKINSTREISGLGPQILYRNPHRCKSHEDSIFKALRDAAVAVYRKALITKKISFNDFPESEKFYAPPELR